MFLGAFGLLNLLGDFISPGFDANLWWIDLPGVSRSIERGVLGWSAICLLWFVFSRQLNLSAKVIQSMSLVVLFETSIWNAATVSNLIAASEIQSRSPVSFSVLVTVALALVLCGVWATRSPSANSKNPPAPWRKTGILSICLGCAIGFPVAQMYCYGGTDYRRSADVIVILGAKVYSDGEVSAALDERLRTGCDLYHQGFAPRMLMSGGPSQGPIHETEAMRDRAIALGVPATAILLDRDGLNTQATASNTIHICREKKWPRVLAVSQFYHLPRVKLAFHRNGMEVYTVPAEVRYRMRALPYFMLREVAALWMYFFDVRSISRTTE